MVSEIEYTDSKASEWSDAFLVLEAAMNQIKCILLNEIHPKNTELTIIYRNKERVIHVDDCNPFVAVSEDRIEVPYGDRDVKVSKSVCRFVLKPSEELYNTGELKDFKDVIGFRMSGEFERKDGICELKTIYIIPCNLGIMEWNFEIDDMETIKWLLRL